MLDIFLTWPMPLVWLMLTGLLFLRRRAGRTIIVAAALVLVVSSLPIVGRTLLAPIGAGIVLRADASSGVDAAAVVVPTAGSFRDAAGRWWPEEGSIRRFAAGAIAAERFGIPLYAVGGSPLDDQPAEAETLGELLAAGGTKAHLVPYGRNSAESAEALASLTGGLPQPVILVTDWVHVTRMRASLRAQGIAVAASAVPSAFDTHRKAARDGFEWRDVVPSSSGLGLTGAALREYMGISWYLLMGYFELGDL